MVDNRENKTTDALKRLGKELALVLPLVLVRALFIVLTFGILNLGFSVWVFVRTGMAGHAHSAGVLVLLPLAAVPFLPFFALALVIAQKQAVSRLVAAAVESQGPTLAASGGQLLGKFLENEENVRLRASHAAFGRAWQQYLRTRSALPRPLRFLLSQICARIAVADLLDDLSARGVSNEELPAAVMSELIQGAARTFLRPTWKPILVLLTVNVLWFGLLYLKLRTS